MSKKRYYLDANFASQTSEEVWKLVTEFQLYHRSNFDATYQIASLEEKITTARRQITQAIGADTEDYLYATSSHSQNIFFIFYVLYQNFIYHTGKNIVLISAFDRQTEKALQPFVSVGCIIKKIVPNAKGQITKQEVEDAISPKTAFISLPFADPVTGVIYPIWDIGEYCRQMGIFFHVEVSRILGQIIFPFSRLPADFLSFDGRYLSGLSGIAITFVKKQISLAGFWREKNRLDMPGLLIALGFAVNSLSNLQEYNCLEIARHKSIFEKKLTDAMPSVQILFPCVEQLSNTSVIAFPGLHSEALLYALQDAEIIASVGESNYESLAGIVSTCPEFADRANQCIHCSFTNKEKTADFEEIIYRMVKAVQSLSPVTGIL